MSDYFGRGNKDSMHGTHQSKKTVDHVLYLTHFAFGFPTGGNAPCSNMWLTASTRERERRCSGVTSVIFRYGVHIFCHTKTVPIHCNEKHNGKCTLCERVSANCLPVNKSMASWRSQSQDREENWKKATERKDHQPQATPQAMLQAKYLPSGYALGYASGKFFISCENFRDFQKYSRGLCPRLRFRQFLNKYSPSGYAAGYFLKKFCLQAMPPAKFQGTHGATPPAKFFRKGKRFSKK
ncbi:hypothetical protein T06_7124 [Trichinella sp. T6]|nr:hypothetical protein T06_7124 [Trichinella sp. T6]